MIKVEIVADSINPADNRLTTFVLTYPRYIHSELMTHRVFSRNAASSRAIPFNKMVKAIQENIAMPVKWGAEQKGMQSGDALDLEHEEFCKTMWIQAAQEAVYYAKQMHDMGLHKSICNRLLEPFMHMTTILSATEFDNFWKLRCHKDAEPTLQALAYEMLHQYEFSDPVWKEWGEWHIPFPYQGNKTLTIESNVKISTARAARVSYLTYDKELTIQEQFELHDRMALSGHWSPFEHCAHADEMPEFDGNFVGWRQYRKQFKGEDGRK